MQLRVVEPIDQEAMDQILILEPSDFDMLMATEPPFLLGRILELNRAPRYHNALNAIVLASHLVELRLRNIKLTKLPDRPEEWSKDQKCP